uniref:Carboxypeptidase B n=1 Tax=Aedes aegypti TaxID=7159 RepID=A4GRM8_AEDAE|nr:carboxypeptidase B [Aedes aegypti]
MQILGAVLLFSALLTSYAICEEVLYKGYKIYDVQTTTRSDLKFLQTVSRDLGLDILSSPKIGRTSSVIVSPSNDEIFRSFLSKQNVTHKLLQGDIQRLIDHERNSNDIHIRKRRTVEQNDTIPIVNFNGANFEYFWSLNDIYKYLNTLNEKYPNLVKVVDHGTTHENRSIKVITISTNGEVNGSRPVVLLDGGVHAREWASHMAVVYLIYQLVERSAENMDLLNNTDWVIMPVVNPDGYEYTQKDRLWRKNRSPNNNTVCFGTDLNRNFPIGWGNFGSECSVGYAGASPASEHETQALIRLMEKYSNATKVYLTVHSCGDFILYPFGYKYESAPNRKQLQSLGEQAAAAVRAINGPLYSVGSSSALLYPANGSDDYIYECLNVEYAYTLELSCGDSNKSSIFIISIAEMQRINKEAFEMFKVFGKFAGKQIKSSG